MKPLRNAFAAAALLLCGTLQAQQTTFTNPVLNLDMPDMSVVRQGDDFYMISTTMHLMPGAPVMHSTDMVHWKTVSYVFDNLTDNSKYDLINGTVYGRGQWASSIRFNNGKYYVLFSPNDQPFKSYLYSTENPSGKWSLVSRMPHFHDNSLLFDDDGRVYVFYGTGNLRELRTDLTDVKEGGVDMRIFERDSTETGLLEGSQVIKHNGKYYLLMISWPQGKPRRQVCYRADNITGPYEKKVILQSTVGGFPYCGQGCIVDDKNGNWHALIFQDRGAIGRVPLLMPVRWEDGWPMLGNAQGLVSECDSIALPTNDSGWRFTESDNFDAPELKNQWQWNHNPVNSAWSLSERAGHLRLKTCRVVDNLYAAPNTLTQRMEGYLCSGTVALDLSNMKDGDVAGLAAFNGHSGVLAVVKEDRKMYLTMSHQTLNMDADKNISSVDVDSKSRVEIKGDEIYLRIDGDFNLNKDLATFYYSVDNENWTKIGADFKMRFDYKRLFMGTRFAIFNYATKAVGGYVDVDFFDYNCSQK